MQLPPNVTLHDYSPTPVSFREAVVSGLSKPQKTLPCQFFYDERGSALFEQICELPEYYPTRTEVALLRRHGAEIAQLLGHGAARIELRGRLNRRGNVMIEVKDNGPGIPPEIARKIFVPFFTTTTIPLRM